MDDLLPAVYNQQDQLRQRHAELLQWASEDGILDQARKSTVPERLGSFFNGLVDVLMREEYAVAGAWDVIQGTADEGDTIGGRVFAELFGETKLGNLLGVDERQREEWGKILEQGGVGEGASLSDLLGQNTLTKYFDPTVRDTAALGLSVFTSPTTYVTVGAKGATKVMSKAGEIFRLSKGSKEILEEGFKRNLFRKAEQLGIENAAARELGEDLESEVISRTLEKQFSQSLSEQFRVTMEGRLRNQLYEEGLQESAEVVSQKIAQGVSKASLGLESYSVRFMGQKVLDLDGLANKAIKPLVDSLRMNRLTRPLIEGIDEVAAEMDKYFQRLPFAARRNETFRRLEHKRWSYRQAAPAQANDMLYGKSGIFTKAQSKALLTSREANNALIQVLDTAKTTIPLKPGNANFGKAMNVWIREAEKIGITANEATGIVGRLRRHFDILGESAVRNELIEESTWHRYAGRYIPRGLKEEFRNNRVLKPFVSFSGGDIGVHSLTRHFKTHAEFRDRIAQKFVEQGDTLEQALKRADDAIEWNVQKLALDYTSGHLRALADAELANAARSMIAPSWNSVFRELSKETAAVARNLNDRELLEAADLIGMLNSSVEDNIVEAVKAVENLPLDHRAAIVLEGAKGLTSFHELDTYMSRVSKIIDKSEIGTFARITGAGANKASGEWREIILENGPQKGKPLLLPKGVADALKANEAALSSRLPAEASKILRAYDFLQNTFKRTHTILFPSFHVRNIISNIAALSVETNVLHMMSPSFTHNVVRLMANAGEDFTLKLGGRKYTRQELRNLMVSMDIIPDRFKLDDLTGEGTEMLARVKGLRKVDERVSQFGQGIENFTRASYFLSQLERGVSPVDAAMKVKQVLFDYADLSFTQREFIRRLFPFATWTMKNVELQVKNLITKPGRVAAQVRVVNQGDRGPEADLLPEFMRGEMKVRLDGDPGKATLITGIDLPINNIDILWTGGVGKTLREQFSMFTPILKAPLEWMLNLDTFNGQPIKGRRWLGQMGPIIERTWPKSMREWIELDKIETADGRTVYKGNGTKIWLLSKNLFLGRLFNESVSWADIAVGDGTKRDKAIALFKALSGMRFTEMDLTDAQRAKLSSEVRSIESFLLNEGSIADFSRTFRPKNKQAQSQILGRF